MEQHYRDEQLQSAHDLIVESQAQVQDPIEKGRSLNEVLEMVLGNDEMDGYVNSPEVTQLLDEMDQRYERILQEASKDAPSNAVREIESGRAKLQHRLAAIFQADQKKRIHDEENKTWADRRGKRFAA
jgi:type III secretory pathway component EscV